MLTGMVFSNRCPETSECRTVEPNYLTNADDDFKIHSTSLMPNITYGAPVQIPEPISSSIFINDEATKLSFAGTIMAQNYLTTAFAGRAPLDWYGPPTQPAWKVTGTGENEGATLLNIRSGKEAAAALNLKSTTTPVSSVVGSASPPAGAGNTGGQYYVRFTLTCPGGDPSYERRYFGTSGAMRNNASANDLVKYT